MGQQKVLAEVKESHYVDIAHCVKVNDASIVDHMRLGLDPFDMPKKRDELKQRKSV